MPFRAVMGQPSTPASDILVNIDHFPEKLTIEVERRIAAGPLVNGPPGIPRDVLEPFHSRSEERAAGERIGVRANGSAEIQRG